MIFEDWGLIDYQTALDRQLKYVDQVAENSDHPGYLIFCKHSPVVTTGRQTEATDIFGWDGPVIDISRGGKATYHGPSQVVVYPILNLKNSRSGRHPQEIRGYLRDFEKGIIQTLKEYDISAQGQQGDDTGVWIDQVGNKKKIASLGIAVKKWVCFHGAAINVHYDPLAFTGINPCGFKTETMISMEQILDTPINEDTFKEKLKKNLSVLL